MRKGKLTREMILDAAARLFNSRGYSGASMSDLMEATGLEKGGIYNHFQSKDELVLEAFTYAVRVHGEKLQAHVGAAEGAINKLLAVLEAFQAIVEDPPIPGGCPLMNSAIESDDTHPLLKERVQKAMGQLLDYVESIVKQGIKSGEIRKDLEPHTTATFLIASLEGGIMLSKLYDDKQRMCQVISQMCQYVKSCAQT